MEDPDVNVIYIHAPKTNDWISWMLNAGGFIFFCLGVMFLWILLKIASDVGHSLELLQVQKTAEKTPEVVCEKKDKQQENKAQQLLITIYDGSKPKPNGGGSGIENFSRYCQLPGATGVRRRESSYFGLPERPPTTSMDSPYFKPDCNQNYGMGLSSSSCTAMLSSFDTLLRSRYYQQPRVNHNAGASPPNMVTCSVAFKNSSGTHGTVSTSFSNGYQNPTGTERSSFLYYGMPRNAPRSSDWKTPFLTSIVHKPSTSSGSEHVISQRYKNASASSDLFESMNNGAPFPDFYRVPFSQRPRPT